MGALVRIRAGQTEPIVAFALDKSGVPLIGKTDLFVKIRRLSDGFYFDWSDQTFKISGSVVTLNQVLSEVDATNSPGEYHLNSVVHVLGWDTSKVTNFTVNETYFVRAVQTPGTDIVNLEIGEIKVGLAALVNRSPVIF